MFLMVFELFLIIFIHFQPHVQDLKIGPSAILVIHFSEVPGPSFPRHLVKKLSMEVPFEEYCLQRLAKYLISDFFIFKSLHS